MLSANGKGALARQISNAAGGRNLCSWVCRPIARMMGEKSFCMASSVGCKPDRSKEAPFGGGHSQQQGFHLSDGVIGLPFLPLGSQEHASESSSRNLMSVHVEQPAGIHVPAFMLMLLQSLMLFLVLTYF